MKDEKTNIHKSFSASPTPGPHAVVCAVKALRSREQDSPEDELERDEELELEDELELDEELELCDGFVVLRSFTKARDSASL